MQRLHNFPFNTRDVVKMSIIWSYQGEGVTPWLAESNCENIGPFFFIKWEINQNYGNIKSKVGRVWGQLIGSNWPNICFQTSTNSVKF